MPSRIDTVTVPCAVCGAKFLAKATRQKYCGKRCAKVGLKSAVARQSSRRQFLKEINVKRAENGYDPPLGISKEAWRVASDPTLTTRQKFERMPELDRRIVIAALERAQRDARRVIESLTAPGR